MQSALQYLDRSCHSFDDIRTTQMDGIVENTKSTCEETPAGLCLQRFQHKYQNISDRARALQRISEAIIFTSVPRVTPVVNTLEDIIYRLGFGIALQNGSRLRESTVCCEIRRNDSLIPYET